MNAKRMTNCKGGVGEQWHEIVSFGENSSGIQEVVSGWMVDQFGLDNSKVARKVRMVLGTI